jgi:hypothetical protein
MDSGDVVFEHRSGEEISLDSEVVLTIAGRNKEFWTVQELLSHSSTQNNMWNIGEQLIYQPSQNLTDVQIEAIVVDSDTKALIFWGMLQEGYVIPPYGLGGIWHFDEPYWNGTEGEVKDSSGNNNNGTAYGGATTVADSQSGRAGSFNSVNYVNVTNHYSLNLEDQITVETWMKPLTFNAIIETQEYSNLQHGYEPDMIHISDDVYAVVSRGQTPHKGQIDTLTISEFGVISDEVIDEINFDRFCYDPNITRVSDDIYVVAYRNQQHMGVLITVEIYPSGNISEPIIAEYQFENSECNKPNIIHVINDIFAIAYRGPDDDGFLKTFQISSNGQNINPIATHEFDTVDAWTPNIIRVDNDVFAIVYRGPDDDGYIKTVRINPAGQIIDTGYISEFEASNCYEPDLIHIINDVFAIAYRGPDDDGFIKTITIAPDGRITPNAGSILEFDTEDCDEPDIIHATGDTYALAYSKGTGGGNRNGVVIAVEILPDGSITYSGNPITTSIGQDKCFGPKITYIAPRVYAVTYWDMSSHPLHITTIILGEDPTPPWYRGIFKSGSVNLYADENNVYASITTADDAEHRLTLSNTITPDTNWYHISLTFDGLNIRLYCNRDTDTFTTIDSQTFTETQLPSQQKIKPSTSDLLFGYLFYGYLDEIAINEKALSDSEIQNHFENPGSFQI